jgi:hypothetical protein
VATFSESFVIDFLFQDIPWHWLSGIDDVKASS